MIRKLRFVLASLAGLFITLMTEIAHAQSAAPAANDFERESGSASRPGIGIAIAAFGGALGQGRTASSR